MAKPTKENIHHAGDHDTSDSATDPYNVEPEANHTEESPAQEEQQAAPSEAVETNDLERLKRELEESKSRLLRSQAELENFRRRTRRDMEDERRFASQPLLMDLLPVLDNVERAIEAAAQSDDSSGLLQGFRMVHDQLLEVLQRHHCPRIGEVGEPFDPSLHEAIAQEPSNEYPKGTVTRVNLNGYKLHDRIIRPAQVVVSKGELNDS